MKHNYIMILVMACWALFSAGSSLTQTTNEGRSKVGGFVLPDRAFGVFGVAAHVNRDSTLVDYVNYSARFALWVGTVTTEGQVLVTAGTGNTETHRPEWTPAYPSFQVDPEPPFPQVEKVVQLAYTDAPGFEGHTPVGVRVEQTVYGFRNTGFAILDFAISLASREGSLDEVYVGFWGDVDAPNSEARKTAANDKVGFALKGAAPFIFDSSVEGDEIPMLGAMILGVADPIVSWWNPDADPDGDSKHYEYLKGEVPVIDPQQPDDFRFLLSYGPLALKAGETLHFPVALVQAPQLDDFEDNLSNATEFFEEELGGGTLEKAAMSFSAETAAADLLPRAFKLYANFPNPFNPETRIQFDLPAPANVELRLYNALGQLVRTLANGAYPAGSFAVTWDSRDDAGRLLPSGLYVYRLQAGDFQAQGKLLLLK